MTLTEEQEVPKFVESWRLQLDDTILSGVDLGNHLLAALPSTWQPFITTRTNAQLTIPTLIPAILQEHILRTTVSCSSSHNPIAMFA